MPYKKDFLIIKSAGLIGIATFISRILGLVREQILLALFTRFQTDAFNVAFRIPNLLRDLFAEGALSAAFVPTFTKTLHSKGSTAAWHLGSLVFNFLFLIIGALVVAGILNAPLIVKVIAGDFSNSIGKLPLTVHLAQLMFPFLLLVALASVAMGMLNSHKQFFVPALAPALFNIGSILVTVLMFYVLPKFGIDPVIGLAIGVLIGGLMQLLIQFPSLLKLGFKYSPSLSIKNSALQHILLLMGPGILGLGATQINLFINTWLATTQGEGPVTWLNAAFRLMYLPIGIFGVAVASATLPVISSQIAEKRLQEVRSTVSSSLRLSLFFNVPASVGLICLSYPIVSLIYQRGQFGTADSWETSEVLILYSLGLSAYSAVKLLVPTFYAIGSPRIPVIISTITIITNITLNLLFINSLGYKGLALFTSLSAFLNFFLLYYCLQKTIGPLQSLLVATTLGKLILVSLIMGLGSHYCYQLLATIFLQENLWWELITVFTSIGIGILLFVIGCTLLRIAELNQALDIIRNRLVSSKINN